MNRFEMRLRKIELEGQLEKLNQKQFNLENFEEVYKHRENLNKLKSEIKEINKKLEITI